MSDTLPLTHGYNWKRSNNGADIGWDEIYSPDGDGLAFTIEYERRGEKFTIPQSRTLRKTLLHETSVQTLRRNAHKRKLYIAVRLFTRVESEREKIGETTGRRIESILPRTHKNIKWDSPEYVIRLTPKNFSPSPATNMGTSTPRLFFVFLIFSFLTHLVIITRKSPSFRFFFSFAQPKISFSISHFMSNAQTLLTLHSALIYSATVSRLVGI